MERLPNESDLSYHRRIVYGKLQDKTLADVDYSELSELAYGQPYSSDMTRKMMSGSYRTLKMMDRDAYDDAVGSPLMDEIESKKMELMRERQKFYDQRREFNKLVTESARRENLEDRLVQVASELPDRIGAMYGDGGSVMFEPSDNEAVLFLCDWHYGMVANNVWNTYNTEICRQRVRYVVDAAAERIARHGCRKLHVIVLGDMIHGGIHVSARVASEELVCEQIMHVAEILAQSIEYLKTFVPEVDVYLTYGNHARTTPNKKESIHRDNMERLIPWWLEQRLSGRDGICVMEQSDNEFILADVCGYHICATHGDLDSVKSSPRLLSTLFQKKYGCDIDYVVLADKHHAEGFEELGIESMICGALCGADEYANGKRLYSTPKQLLLIFNEANGLDAEYKLRCESRVCA